MNTTIPFSIELNVLREDAYFYIELFQLKMERKQILEIIDFFIDIYNFEEVLIVVPNLFFKSFLIIIFSLSINSIIPLTVLKIGKWSP